MFMSQQLRLIRHRHGEVVKALALEESNDHFGLAEKGRVVDRGVAGKERKEKLDADPFTCEFDSKHRGMYVTWHKVSAFEKLSRATTYIYPTD